MDSIMRLTEEKTKKQDRKGKISLNTHVTAERIEKLKKTFQPFWMRGMIPHKKEEDQILNGRNNLSHI